MTRYAHITRLSGYLLAITLIAVLTLLSGVASAESIRVASIDGEVSYRVDSHSSWQNLKAGMALQMPVDVKTASGGRAVITQAGSSFTVKSNSRVTLQGDKEASGGLINRIKQWFGTVFYDVERQPDTFSVETPFLVSTVKGTEFVIVSTDTASYVTLNEGRLQVQDLESGSIQIINPGEIAGSSSASAGVKTIKQTPSATSSQTRGPEIAAPTGFADSADNDPEDGFDGALDGITEVATEQQLDMADDNDMNGSNDRDGDADMGSDMDTDEDIGGDPDMDDEVDTGGDMDTGEDIGGAPDMDEEMDTGDDMEDDTGMDDDMSDGGKKNGCNGNGNCNGHDKEDDDDEEDDD